MPSQGSFDPERFQEVCLWALDGEGLKSGSLRFVPRDGDPGRGSLASEFREALPDAVGCFWHGFISGNVSIMAGVEPCTSGSNVAVT